MILVQDAFGSVSWVELAWLSEPHLVLPTIARQVGMEEALSDDPRGALHAFLSGRRMLLVLDNFEHLAEAARIRRNR